MIEPTNEIMMPAQVADGIWINSIMINAPTVTGKVTANIRVMPFNSESGSLFPTLGKTIYLNDVMSASVATPSIGNAMQTIFIAVQELVISRSLF